MSDKEITPAAHGAETDGIRQLIQTHGLSAAIGIGIAAIALAGGSWYRGHTRAAAERAAEMLGVASSPAQLEEIARQYPATVSAQIAMLGLAKAHYDSGNYPLAMSTYEEFETKYPKHPMAPAARLGRIHCTEAMGQTEEALAGFTAFVTNAPRDFLAPTALLGKARVLETLRLPQEARMAYEDLIANYPDSPRAAEAEQKLAALKAREKSDREKPEAPVSP